MDIIVFLLILKVANSRLKKLQNLKKGLELKFKEKESINKGNKYLNNEISCNKNKIFKDEKLIKSIRKQ